MGRHLALSLIERIVSHLKVWVPTNPAYIPKTCLD